MTTLPIRILSAAAFTIVLLVGVTARQEPKVSFSSRVELVLVDVNAVDSASRPINDLRKEDFTVTVDGVPRKVAAANFVGYSRAGETQGAEAPAATGDTARRLDFSTNQGPSLGPPRLVLLVIDENNIRIGGGQALMKAAARFVDQLQPSDRVGLTSFPAGPRVEITGSRRAVKDALSRIVGHRPERMSLHYVSLSEAFEISAGNQAVYQQVADRECILATGVSRQGVLTTADESAIVACRIEVKAEAQRIANQTMENARTTLQVLTQLMKGLRDVEGPKTVLLISEALPLDNRGELLNEIMSVATVASEARAAIYGVRIDPPPADVAANASIGSVSVQSGGERSFLVGGFETLVSAAGGTLFSTAGSGDNAFSRVALELSGYYLLGFEPQASDRDGKPHKIAVRVARNGAQVRARREFVVASTGYRAGESDNLVLTRTLRSSYLATEFPLSLAAYPVRDRGGSKVRILMGADVDADAVAPTGYAVGVTLRDRQGNVINTFLQRLVLQPRGRLGPFAYSASVPVDPGDYVVKLAVRDSKGRSASVEHPVNARFSPAGPFDTAALIVADEEGAAGGKWHPSVDGTVRVPRLAVYLELHAENRASFERLTASLDVAEREQTASLLTTRLALEEDDVDRRVAFGRLDVGLLPPGSYVVRVIGSVGDRAIAQVARSINVLPSASIFASPGVGSRARIIPFPEVGRPFGIERVMTPEVVAPLLDRLAVRGQPAAAGLQPAIDLARAGRYERIADVLPAGQQTLEATFLRGLSLLARRDLERASAEFRSAVRAQNDFFPAVFYLAACYAAGGRDREAAAGFATAMAGESDLQMAYTESMDARARLADWAGARTVALDAAARWPDDAAIARRAIAAHVMIGEDDAAYAGVVRHLQAHADDQEALFLALRLLAQGQGEPGRAPGALDREAFARYAGAYAAAGGPRLALVRLWERHVAKE